MKRRKKPRAMPPITSAVPNTPWSVRYAMIGPYLFEVDDAGNYHMATPEPRRRTTKKRKR